MNKNFEITGTTRLLALFGRPVSHSISPMMHNEAFRLLNLDYRYFCLDVGEEELEEAFNAMKLFNFRGCNCTMPDKNKAFRENYLLIFLRFCGII